MEKNVVLTMILSGIIATNGFKYFAQLSDTDSSLSTLYTRDKTSDIVTNQCLKEMYPQTVDKHSLHVDKNDIPCIIHCVLKKFGIMSNDGRIDIKKYHRRVQAIHRYDRRVLISDVGETCAQNINAMNLDHDLCKKAKVFNDCTQLYVIAFKESSE